MCNINQLMAESPILVLQPLDFIVMAMIYSFSKIPVAHFNPAVTIGFAFAK